MLRVGSRHDGSGGTFGNGHEGSYVRGMWVSTFSKPNRAASPFKYQNPIPPPRSVSVAATTPAPMPPVRRRAQRMSPLSARTVIAQLGQVSAAGMLQPPASSSALAKSGANG